MHILHKDALGNKYHASMWHSSTQNILHRGGRALIHLKQIGFASLLTVTCDSQISFQMICRRRNHSIANYKEVILKNAQLRLKFDNFHSTIFF